MRSNKIHISRFWVRITLYTILLFGSVATFAQESKAKEGEKIEGANAVREEIQRYMGYEPIMPRYLSLPYDATTNGNVQGPFVDIGYLFLALIPILFLFGFRKHPWYGIGSMLLLIGVMYISIGSGKIFVKNEFVNTTNFNALHTDKKIKTFPSNIINPIYHSVSSSYKGINSFFRKKSGNADSFTYPILFFLFIVILFLIRQRTLHHNDNRRIFILFISFFTFMWILLTAGIIWYGYPMIALSILLIASSLDPNQHDDENRKEKLIIRGLGIAAFVIFIFLGSLYRFSNYRTNVNDTMATQMFDIGELKYQSGRQNKRKVMEGFFPGGAQEALDKINSDENALVYRVGTVLPFFVKKNDKRVFLDNQLQNFEKLRTHYNNKNTLIEVLKSAGYKYIFVDLLTYTVDQTPERTLENKYKEFMKVLYQNPKIALMATNRRINTSKDPQKPKPDYGVFGTPLPNSYGNYAIFEILD